MIESKVNIKLEDFEVPSMAIESRASTAPTAPAPAPQVTEGYWVAPIVPRRQVLLSEIPPETLLKMCEEFKKEVFKRAGKLDTSLLMRRPRTTE